MKTIMVKSNSYSYDIVIENGIIKNAGTEIVKIYSGKKIAVVTDSNVYKLYGNILKKSLAEANLEAHFIVVKPGEKSKSIETLKYVYDKLIDLEITRSDLIIALGGGVIGDLSGFAASTYLRGIDFVQIPTSLLAQIDSSIGGKVAVNLEQGKNLIGSFYQPKKVIIDPELLNTLPNNLIKDGLGEVIKYACIKNLNLFKLLMSIKNKDELFSSMEHIIHTCCSIKKDIVEKDERDTSIRMALNFGHTMGHALEKYYDYNISHGEAVAVGMYYITRKSEELKYTEHGTSDKIKKILVNFNISYSLPDVDMEKIRRFVLIDKKNLSGNINLIMLRKIGESFIESVPVEKIDNFF